MAEADTPRPRRAMDPADDCSYQVELFVYDLTRGLARTLSPALLGKQIDGIWHTGVVAYGREYFFGSTGIESCRPGGTILGEPDRIEALGESQVPYQLFLEYIFGLGESAYRPGVYDLLKHNCNNFSDDISQFLCGRGVPKAILQLPEEVLNTPLGLTLNDALKKVELKHANSRSINFGPLSGTLGPALQVVRTSYDDPEFDELNDAIDQVRHNSVILEERRNSLNDKLSKKERKERRKEKRERKEKRRKERSETSEERRQRKKKSKPPLPPSDSFVSESGEGRSRDRSRHRQRSHASQSSDTAGHSRPEPEPNFDSDLNTTVETVNNLQLADDSPAEETTTTWEPVDDFWGSQTEDSPSGVTVTADNNTSLLEESLEPPAAYADPSDSQTGQQGATGVQADYSDRVDESGADMENSASQDTAEQQAPPSPPADSGADSAPEVEREPPILFKEDVDVSNHGTNIKGSRGVSVDSNPSSHRSRSLTPHSLSCSPVPSPMHEFSCDLISQSPRSESSLCLLSLDVCLSSRSDSSPCSDLSSASLSLASSQEDLPGYLDPVHQDPNNNSFAGEKRTDFSSEVKNDNTLIPASIGLDGPAEPKNSGKLVGEIKKTDTRPDGNNIADTIKTFYSNGSASNSGVTVGNRNELSGVNSNKGGGRVSLSSKCEEPSATKAPHVNKDSPGVVHITQPNPGKTSNKNQNMVKTVNGIGAVPKHVATGSKEVDKAGIQSSEKVPAANNSKSFHSSEPLNVEQRNLSSKASQIKLDCSPLVQTMPAKSSAASKANSSNSENQHIDTSKIPKTSANAYASKSSSSNKTKDIVVDTPNSPKIGITSTPSKALEARSSNKTNIPVDTPHAPKTTISFPSKVSEAISSSNKNLPVETTPETSSKKSDVVLRKDLAKNIEDFLRRTSAEEQSKRYSYPAKVESSTPSEDSEANRCRSMSPPKQVQVANARPETKNNRINQVKVGQGTKNPDNGRPCFLSEECGIANGSRAARVSGEKGSPDRRPPALTVPQIPADKTLPRPAGKPPNPPQGNFTEPSPINPVRIPNSGPRFSRFSGPSNACAVPNGNRTVAPNQFYPQNRQPPPPYDKAVGPKMGPEYNPRSQFYPRPAYNPREISYNPRGTQGPRAGYDPRAGNNPRFVRISDERPFRPEQPLRDTGQVRQLGPTCGPAFRQPGVLLPGQMRPPGPRPQPISLYYDAQGKPVGPWVYPTPRIMGPSDNASRFICNPPGGGPYQQNNPKSNFQENGQHNMDQRSSVNCGAVLPEKPNIKTSPNAPKKPPRSNPSSNSSLDSHPSVPVILNPNDGIAPATNTKTAGAKFHIHPPEYYGRRSQERGSSFTEDDQGSSVDCDSDATPHSTEQYPTSHDSSSSSLCRSSTSSSSMSFGSSYYMLYVVDPIERAKTPEDHLSSPETSPTPEDSTKEDALVTCAENVFKSDSTSSITSFRTITPDPDYFDDNDKAFRELRGLSQTSSDGSFEKKRSRSNSVESGFTLINSHSNSSNDQSVSESENGASSKRPSGRQPKRASSQPSSPCSRRRDQLSRACSLESLSSLLRRIPRTPSPFSSLSTLDLIVPSMSNSPPSVTHPPDRPPSTDSPILLGGAEGATRGSQDSLVLYRPVPRYPPNSGAHSASPEPLPAVLCYLAPARQHEQPLVFPEVYLEARRDFDELAGCCMQQLAAEEQKHMEELRAYVVEDDGAWALGENFGDLFSRIFNDPNIPDKARFHLVRILAVAALKDDVILLLHQDRKDHTIMNFVNKIEHLTPDLQEAIALFFCNMFEHLSPSEWLLYISEWAPEGSMPISNIRVTTKVAVNALLHSNEKVQNYGTAIMYNLGTKEVKTVVFDDVAPELAMAILQFFNTKPKEELLWRTVTALCRFCYASSEVPSFIKMIGPEPSNFKGLSERIDTVIEEINAKLSRVRLF